MRPKCALFLSLSLSEYVLHPLSSTRTDPVSTFVQLWNMNECRQFIHPPTVRKVGKPLSHPTTLMLLYILEFFTLVRKLSWIRPPLTYDSIPRHTPCERLLRRVISEQSPHDETWTSMGTLFRGNEINCLVEPESDVYDDNTPGQDSIPFSSSCLRGERRGWTKRMTEGRAPMA